MKGHIRERGKGNWYAVIAVGKKRKWIPLKAAGTAGGAERMRAAGHRVDRPEHRAAQDDGGTIPDPMVGAQEADHRPADV